MSTDGTRLSPHFLLREFACPCGCVTTPMAVEALTALCIHVLEPLRADVGVALHIHSATAAWRTTASAAARRTRSTCSAQPQTCAASARTR
jgi:hypothetical protein